MAQIIIQKRFDEEVMDTLIEEACTRRELEESRDRKEWRLDGKGKWVRDSRRKK